ncbi:MAG: PHB depolymerase family esterase [FCB group bacterium]|jgi:polyhydroxybutyrate depolymerase|nr:PHB depolymerase family esterase [FCB group bacterium]
MKSRLPACCTVLLVTLLLCGCPHAPSDTESQEFSFGGRDRSYLIHVPEAVDGGQGVPLVLVLHGFAETAAAAARTTDFASLADREGFIVAFPNAVRRTWHYHSEASTPGYLRNVDDVAFLAALIERIKSQHPVDPRRIYIAGFSNGGFMAQRFACERADLVAAVAAVGASMAQDNAEACAPANPIPVVLVAGLEDPIIPWAGGDVQMGPGRRVSLLSIEATARKWAAVNGCSAEPTVVELPNVDPNDGTRVERREFGACTGTSSVVLYAVEGGGHAWPGSPHPYPEWIVGRTSKDINGPQTVWDFFEVHSKPAVVMAGRGKVAP